MLVLVIEQEAVAGPTFGDFSGSNGCMISTSTAVGPFPSKRMSSSTFSFSET